jgi:hypothetical protein
MNAADFIKNFIRNLVTHGLEYYGRFYGIYHGTVFANADPGGQGRILVKVPVVSGDDVLGEPAWPSSPYAGRDHGIFFPPEKDEAVLVWFENGDIRYPWYIGQWWASDDDKGEDQGKSELPDEFKTEGQPGKDWDGKESDKKAPYVRGIKMLASDAAKSFLMLFSREPEKDQFKIIHPELSEFLMDEKGSITTKDKNENTVYLDAENKEIVITNKADNENIITMKGEQIEILHAGGSKITLKGGEIFVESDDKVDVKTKEVEVTADKIMLGGGASEKMVLGNQFKTWVDNHINTTFNTHFHGSGVGPTSPPTVPAQPPTPATYSSRVFGKK